jgi:flagellar biosynthesis protein FlhF
MLGPLARELRELREKVDKLAARELPPPPSPLQDNAASEAPVGGNGKAAEPPRAIAKEEREELKRYLLNAIKAKEKTEIVPVAFPAHPAAEVQAPAVGTEKEGVEQVMSAMATELKEAGIDGDAIEILLAQVRPMAETTDDRKELRHSLIDAFAHLIKTSGPVRMKKNGPRIIALVGPTGVGKTTTTAKLAAMYAMHKGAKVSLVTTDNFRVGAFEQLKTYSKIMGVPLEIAGSSLELIKATELHADKDLIIIDTAGRSPKDHGRLDELKTLLDAGLEVETHLCLSATTKDKELSDAIAKFSVIPISSLLFTKLDEAESLGTVINTHHRSKLPLSYFTNGQMVPEDIVVATPRKLANLIMREAV